MRIRRHAGTSKRIRLPHSGKPARRADKAPPRTFQEYLNTLTPDKRVEVAKSLVSSGTLSEESLKAATAVLKYAGEEVM